jgi:hypothetical protein
VVGLLLLTSADVARYRLPNHPFSPCPHSFSAASAIPICLFITVLRSGSDESADPAGKRWENCWNCSRVFHRTWGGRYEIRWAVNLRQVKSGWQMASCLEMGLAARNCGRKSP